jgi:hypothetical protein
MKLMHRKGWTGGEIILAGVYMLLCPLVGFFAFVEIYQTVTHLVHVWFGDWAWIVPAAAEGLFTGLYAGWLLLELKDKPRPPRPVRFMLTGFTAACMAGSYWLNIASAHGVVDDAVAHVIVVTAFFGVLIVGKVLVRRLKVTPAERAMETAREDARQYAIDLVRAVRGRWWRYREDVPSLLKGQIRNGRLPDAVIEDIKLKVSIGRTSGWQETVRGWVFGPDGLGLAALAAEASRIALSDITRSAAGNDLADTAAVTLASTPVVTPELPPVPPADSSRSASRSASARSRVVPSKASDEDLAELVLPLFADGSEVTKYRIIKAVREASGGKAGIGDKRAGEILELARRKRRAQRVVPIGDRKTS